MSGAKCYVRTLYVRQSLILFPDHCARLIGTVRDCLLGSASSRPVWYVFASGVVASVLVRGLGCYFR